MAASTVPFVELARTLPPRLTRFFTKFPPRISPNSPHPPAPVQQSTAPASSQTSETDNAMEITTTTAPKHILEGHPIADIHHNPFLPWKNPVTGRWRGAMFGLRKQADLCKLARSHGVEDLLPWSRKKSAVKAARREQLGVRIRGTGVGQKVKGHIWERAMVAKLDKRREAMRNMPALIKEWKTRGHGKGWKKWPK